MIVALFPNASKPDVAPVAREIKQFLLQHQVEVVAEDENAALLDCPPLSSVKVEDINFVITLGGDGTILRLVHRHPELQAPIMPINMGSLGFMADITLEEIIPSLTNLLEGKYQIQTRMVMEGQWQKNKKIAVNDIVIHRATNPCLIDLAIYVDDRYLNTFSADGIIIATPSGSTAYSLSAGGPIVTPELNAFIITPICPHTISNRPIVVMPERHLRIEYLSPYNPIEVTYDGFPCYFMAKRETLHVQRAQRSFLLVTMPTHDYFSTLRTKLGWSGKLRN